MPDLYYRRMIRLDELGQRKDSSSDISSVYKREHLYTQTCSIYTHRRIIRQDELFG